MKFFTLEEILEEKLKDPEFRAGFEAEKRVLAAERAEIARSRPVFAHSRSKSKQRVFTAKLGRTGSGIHTPSRTAV